MSTDFNSFKADSALNFHQSIYKRSHYS